MGTMGGSGAKLKSPAELVNESQNPPVRIQSEVPAQTKCNSAKIGELEERAYVGAASMIFGTSAERTARKPSDVTSHLMTFSLSTIRLPS
jgi:hypothetical protein